MTLRINIRGWRFHFCDLISWNSHARAWVQSYLAVRGEMPSTSDASSLVMPTK